jgi:hypothetical protein
MTLILLNLYALHQYIKLYILTVKQHLCHFVLTKEFSKLLFLTVLFFENLAVTEFSNYLAK